MSGTVGGAPTNSGAATNGGAAANGTAGGIAFVHGGKHDGRCWRPTMDVIAARAPELPMVAVDLPGRGGTTGDMSLAGCVASAVEQINKTGLESLLLVGHSLAGVTVPLIAAELGADRVVRIVAISCCVPPQGKTTADTVSLLTQGVARLLERVSFPRPLARWLFCNGMTAEQRALSMRLLVPDAPDTPGLTRVPADRSTLPASIPRTWVLTTRDRVVPPRVQRRFAANLGVSETVPIDTGHNAMIADPHGLADILLARLTASGTASPSG
jgi:pimeloyl-ACP methyl ester carboxylesterase